MTRFAHLHVHSDFSPQDGIASLDDIVKKAVSLDMDAVAITDHGRAGGLLKFKKACDEHKVRPIYGVELYTSPLERTLRQPVEGYKPTYHLTVLAKNNKGLRNLFRLTSLGWLDGFYHKPRVDIPALSENREGLIVLSGCAASRISQMLLMEQWDDAIEYTNILRSIFRDDFYIEVQNHGLEWQGNLKKLLFELSYSLDIPIVATQDAHYVDKEDAELHRHVTRLAAGRLEFETDQLYFKSGNEMQQMFEKDEQHALANTLEVAKKCTTDWEYGKTIWPVYDTGERTPEKALRDDTGVGFRELFGAGTREYRERVDYELSVIEKMGFATYFLVVADFINWARENRIPVGPGRGSVAGSLVAYCLGITRVDPIKYGLYFERFLNPNRVSLPDIDVDFCKQRRDKVIEYVVDKYGKDRVAQIGTYAVFKPRGSLRDFARVCGYERKVGDILAGLIPPDIAGKQLTFDESIEAEPKLLKNDWPDVVELARKAEGLHRQPGVHAAGVVIANTDLRDLVPLYRGKNSEIATQFTMDDVEEIGLVKLDFLGLKNLTVIRDTIELVQEIQQKEIDIDAIDMEDQEVFEKMFQRGNLDGVFQFETSSGFKDLCVRVKPQSVEDLSVITSLFRPGPLCLSGDVSICTSIEKTHTKKSQNRCFKYKKLKDLYNIYQSKSDLEWQTWPYWLVSMNEDTQQFVKSKIKSIYKSGTKPVYKALIRTHGESYRENTLTGKIRRDCDIKASLDHRFLTINGWKRLQDLKPGDYICIINKVCGNIKPRHDCKTVHGRKNFRNVAFYNYQYHCVFCDWNKGSLDVNHITGNRNTNNHPDNLCYMCPNHHRMYCEGTISPEKAKLAKEKFRLPVGDFRWVRFEGKELIGEEETYDIEVYGPHHNFIANDFVVHNSTGLTDKYVAGRNGEDPEYLVDKLEPMLRETYGVMVYQEQIMKICTDLAGYTASEADDMRKVIGKKLPDKMKLHREKFINGCTDNGVPPEAATKLFDDIEGFAKYSFNKAHALAYSIISYQTAWLKTHYPHEFYTALLNCSLRNQDDIVKYIFSVRENNIPIEPPDVNRSGSQFTLDNGTIVFGLAGVKGAGEKACASLMEKCPEEGFESLQELVLSGVNTGVIKAFAECGALASICDIPREKLVANLPELIDYYKKLDRYKKRLERIKLREEERQAAIERGEKPLRKLPTPKSGPAEPELTEPAEEIKIDRLTLERQTLGFYLTGHPLDYHPGLTRMAQFDINDLKEGNVENNSFIRIPVVVSTVTPRRTRNKQDMATLTVEDRTGRLEATIFPRQWTKLRDYIKEDSVVVLGGSVRYTAGDEDSLPIVQLVVNFINTIAEVGEAKPATSISMRLLDGSTVKLVHTPKVDYASWQQATAYVNNLERMNNYG
jgi:DNA polymerase-3 subunit alpha